MQNRILLIGSGGREHALAWKLSRSDEVGEIIALPGNPGMESVASCRPIDVGEHDRIVEFAAEMNPDLIVIGPENPIAEGLSDRLRTAGHDVFAPSAAAARLESDKVFAKEFMARHDIPTAASRTFTADQLDEALDYVARGNFPTVIKASGLAAGKGVVIPGTPGEAEEAVRDILSGAAFGEAGNSIVVEEFMQGEEASVFAVTDGTDTLLLAPSQDHKRVGDGDTGPNTGGMGAYAPAPVVTPDLLERIRHEIIEPTLRGMEEEGNPYVGCLFVGLMISSDGAPRVVEFNCRFGDPETQVILPIWQGDLFRLFRAAVEGTIAEFQDPGSSGSAVCVVLASEGYPGSYPKGIAIGGIDRFEGEDDLFLFHAGTAYDGDEIVTAGGRVLGVVAVSPDEDYDATVRRAYEGVEMIDFQGKTYRRDIAHRVLA